MQGVGVRRMEGDVEHFVSANASSVICGSVCENPHGVNSETRCSRAEWIAAEGEGARVRGIVRSLFGEDAVVQIDAAFSGP